MNPMTRKMFKSRDARTKLRGMGGILASSPELAETVQQFQDGGSVGPPVAFVGGRPFYLGKDNRNIVDGKGNVVTDPSILVSISRSMKSQAEARRSASPTGGFDSPQAIASVSADAIDFVPGGVFGATQGGDSPQLNLRQPLESEMDRFTTNLQGVFQPRFPGDTPQQQAMVSADQGAGGGIVLESGPLIQENDGGEYGPAALARRRAEQERRNQARLAAQSATPETLVYGGEPVLTQPDPEADGFVPRFPGDTRFQQAQVAKDTGGEVDAGPNRPQAQGVASFGVFDSIIDQFNLPGSKSFSDSLDEYRLPDMETQSANEQAELASINEQIANAEAEGNSNLAITLNARRTQLLRRQGAGELATGAGEFLFSDVPNFVREQYNKRVAPFITSPEEAAVNLDTLAAEKAEADAARRERKARLELLESGATTVPSDVSLEADTRTAQEFRDAESALARAQGMPSSGAETPAADTSPETGTGTGTAAPVVTEEVVKKVADPKIQKKAAELAPSPDDTEDDIRTKYEARAKLFREILGEDEAGARNKGMDLAMIGLAIMSGQSPNALTNIAQGGAAGLKAMSTRDEAARERQRLIRTTALESVLDEEAAATAAAATAAEKALDRRTRIDVANIGAMSGKDYTSAELVTYRTAYNAAFKAATERGAKPQAVKDGMSPEVYATQMANNAVMSSRNFFSGGSQPPPSAVSSAQELEAAAKAAGLPTFKYNGMEYPVR